MITIRRIRESFPRAVLLATFSAFAVPCASAGFFHGFVQNDGQWIDGCQYAATRDGRSVAVMRDSIVIGERGPRPMAYELRFNRVPSVVAERARSERLNYLLGSDPAAWRTNVPSFEAVRLVGIGDGVDLLLQFNSTFEYDLVVRDGAALANVEIRVSGAGGLAVDDSGNLVLQTPEGPRTHTRPRAYALESDGARREVGCEFRILTETSFGFACDATGPLVIDPSVVFSTYLGGSSDDTIYEMVRHPTASTHYVTGKTTSTNFPTVSGSADTTSNGGGDAFISKLNSAGTALVFSTYLGGSSLDEGYGIALGPNDVVAVTGVTQSTNFPVSGSAFDSSFHGLSDAFVTVLASDGSAISYSSYLGGSTQSNYLGLDFGNACKFDGSGNLYVFGTTASEDFPTTSGAFDQSINNTAQSLNVDTFVSRFDPTASGSASLLQSTYLGGDQSDGGRAIAIDSQGNVCLAACSDSQTGMPITVTTGSGTANAGLDDCYLARMNASLSTLQFGCFIGGSGLDDPTDLALDANDRFYVCGVSYSVATGSATPFPTTSGVWDTTGDSLGDAFVLKANPTVTSGYLAYSSLLGGSALDVAKGIHISPDRNVFVVGETKSSDFPMQSGLDTSLGGTQDAFVTWMSTGATSLVYSSYFGGSGIEDVWGSAFTTRPTVIIAGETSSTGIATTSAYQTTIGGGSDGFLASFDL